MLFSRGRITYYTQPPETHKASTHVGAQIVTEMSKEFDVDSLLVEEQENLKGKNILRGFHRHYMTCTSHNKL